MRLYRFINEAKEKFIKPKTKKFGFYQSNPMGDWLEYERKRAAKGSWGSKTAGFHDFMQIPTKMVSRLKGKMGEVRDLREKRVQELLLRIEKEGILNPIFLNVEYNGEVLINEGNRRALLARWFDFEYIPIEIGYFAGGELISGPFHPDNLVKVAKAWSKEKTEQVIKKKTKRIPVSQLINRLPRRMGDVPR